MRRYGCDEFRPGLCAQRPEKSETAFGSVRVTTVSVDRTQTLILGVLLGTSDTVPGWTRSLMGFDTRS
eukprot:3457800-Prymnesium_polylepis.1